MKVITKVELKLENFEKCSMILDSDCPLGSLYDYSCAVKHFVTQKMQEAESEAKKHEIKQEDKA